MIYPILYDAAETDFGHNGQGILRDAIRCLVTEERNGRFELNMTYPIDGIHSDLIKYDNIIKADAGHALKNQRFRIEQVEKNESGMITVNAKHVSYLANDLVLAPLVKVDQSSASSVLDLWRDSIEGEHPFTVSSDIVDNRSTTWKINNHPNARSVLGGSEGSILDTWGGEYRFDNYDIRLLRNRGSRANTLISYGRNLTDLTQEENIANTMTSIYPYAIYSGVDGEEIITLDEGERVLHSKYIEHFAHPRVLPVDFSREFERGERPTPEKLKELGLAYLAEYAVGEPEVSINLSFVDLTKAINIGGLTQEQLNLCDEVLVRFEKLGIEKVAKVVRIEWDVLLGQYESLEIGSMQASLSDAVRRIERGVSEVSVSADTALRAANGKNTVFFGPNEPSANRVGDLWYRPNGEETEMWMWNGHGWQFIISTAPDVRLIEQINVAKDAAQRALNEANASLERANEVFNHVDPLVRFTDPITGNETTIKALAQGLQAAVNGEDGIESRMTQLASDINLRVTKNDVINQINISEEGILLDGRRIHLTGDTFIDRAVISRALFEDLEAGRIEQVRLDGVKRLRNAQTQTRIGVEVYEVEVAYTVWISNLNQEIERQRSYIIILDVDQNTFAVRPVKGRESDSEKLSLLNNLIGIPRTHYNVFTMPFKTDGNIAIEYYRRFKQMLINNPEEAYHKLDTEFREARFDGVEDFIEFVQDNMDELVERDIERYSVSEVDGYREFVTLDQFGNIYLFRASGIMEFTVKIDTHTLIIRQFLNAFDSASEQGRALLNLQRITEALNHGDFRFAYNKLSPAFRDANFPTLDSFETYVRNVLPRRFTVEHGRSTREGDVHSQVIRFVDRNSENVIEKTFLVLLQQGTDFVYSFNII